MRRWLHGVLLLTLLLFEQFDVARDNSDTIADLSAEIERHRKTVVTVKLQLDEWATTQPAQP